MPQKKQKKDEFRKRAESSPGVKARRLKLARERIRLMDAKKKPLTERRTHADEFMQRRRLKKAEAKLEADIEAAAAAGRKSRKRRTTKKGK